MVQYECLLKDNVLMVHAVAYKFVCACAQQTERVGQSEAMYEVVSLQREAERSNEERGRLASPTEEEEADEGKHFSCFFFSLFFPICFVNLTII